MNKYSIIIFLFIVLLFSACGRHETAQTPQHTSMNLTIKNGPALAEATQYTMIISISGKQYSSVITGNSFNATVKDVPQGYQEIYVNIYEGGGLIAQGYSQLYISPGYNSCIIDFKAPQITHNPALSVMYGMPLTITCSITDDVNQSNLTATLYFSNNGSSYQNISMTKSGSNYSAIIANSYTRGDTVYYYIKASDPYRSGYFGSTGNVSSNVSAIQLLVVPNVAPMIYHTAVSSETQNISITISAQIIDTGGVESAALFYKTSTGNYQSLTMTNTTANTYTAQIPGAFVQTPYTYYYIRAYDGITYVYYGNAGYTLSEPSANPIPITIYQTPDITPPVITHTAQTTTSDSYLISITATVTDDSYVNYVYIKYKKYNDANYQTAVMNNTSGNNWSGYISFITANIDTTYYYLEAYDGRNKSYYGLSGQTTVNPELNNNHIVMRYTAIQQSNDFSISFSGWSASGNAGSFTPDSYSYKRDAEVDAVTLEFSSENGSIVNTLSFNFAYMTTFNTPLPVGTYNLNSGNILLNVEYLKMVNTSIYAWMADASNAGGGASGSVTIIVSTDTYIQGTFTAVLITASLVPSNLATGNITISGNFWMRNITNTVPAQQPSPSMRNKIISTGAQHTVILKNDGYVWECGGNGLYQLGNRTTANRNTLIQPYISINAASVVCGRLHTMALKTDSTVWAWGDNSDGKIGNGASSLYETAPVQVRNLTNIVYIAAGDNHSAAIKNDGTVWAWGDNVAGQLGNGNYLDQKEPVQVIGLTNIIAVACRTFYTIALKNDGTVWALGYDNLLNINSVSPVQITGLTNIIDIATGDNHILVLKSDGTVLSWGKNNYGQLGDGTTNNRTTPTQVSGLTDVSSIACGHDHNIVVKNNGTVWTWGFNYDGQLGDGTINNRYTPIQVSGLSNIISVAGGGAHTVALKNDNTVWAWGWNAQGQLGNGTNTDQYTPTNVFSR